METGVTSKDIISYYDTCEIDYKLVWHLDKKLAMHYGYWDSSTRNLRAALDKMNHVILTLAEVGAGQEVLDAGCGVGGTAIYCAAHFGANVRGISLSHNQVIKATVHAQRAGVQDTTSFSVADYTATGFADNSFDVVYAMESVCHAGRKEDFIAESYRILKPGGRLVVGDFFRARRDLDGRNARLMQAWAASWAVPEFEFYEDFRLKLESRGFSNIEEKDATANIKRSAQRLYWSFIPGMTVHKIIRLMGRRNQLHQKNVWSTYYQYHTLKRGLWKYRTFKAIK